MATELLAQEHVDISQSAIKKIVDNIETVIIGKRESVELVVLAFIAQGHVLLEDLPGTGKTTLVSAMAKSVDCKFRRIQFTPDIMPSDVSGFSIFNQKTRDFEFRPGGVMSNLVLADEINRASAKTQAALLEAMEERQVTVDSKTYTLEEPFMVLATQNPIEQFGTYPLPEAQVDRFLIKLSMGYPAFEQEVQVIELGKKAKKAIQPVVSSDDILALRELAEQVHVSHMVVRYIVEIVTGTRNSPEVQVGSSPRGGIALTALTRAYALLQGRNYAIPDDVKYLAPYVLGHRIQLSHEAKVQGRDEKDVVKSIISSIAVPYENEVYEGASQVTAAEPAPAQVPPKNGLAQDTQISPKSQDSKNMQADSISQESNMVAEASNAKDAQSLHDEPESQKGVLIDETPEMRETSKARHDQDAKEAPAPFDAQKTQDIPTIDESNEEHKPQSISKSAKSASLNDAPDHQRGRTYHEEWESVKDGKEWDGVKENRDRQSVKDNKERQSAKGHEGSSTTPHDHSRLERKKEQRHSYVPMPSNDIASRARASANTKRSFFGRRKNAAEDDARIYEPASKLERQPQFRVQEGIAEKGAAQIDADGRKPANDASATRDGASERGVKSRVATTTPAHDVRQSGQAIGNSEDANSSMRPVSNADNAEKPKDAIPSTPEEVDVQAAFDAAFANMSFDVDDDR